MKRQEAMWDEGEPARVARAGRGDGRAFEELVQAHLPRVWRVVWRILRHREDTEDVVQEVFLAAHRALPSFRGESRFSTWLHRIAVNRALNHLSLKDEKVRREARPLESLTGEGPDAGPSAIAESGTSLNPSPLQHLEMTELKRRLAECLARLPAAWRAVLALRTDESLSYEEMAETLSLAIGTVRSRLARARLALRRCIAEETS